MLQSIRVAAKSWIVKVFMIVLIVSFSIWGVGDAFRTNYLKQPVAKVGDYKITMSEFAALFDQNLRTIKQYNPALTAKEAKQLGLIEETLEREITRLLIDSEVRRLGLRISEKPVLEMVRQEPAFRKEDGSFDKDRFIMLLRQQQVSEAEFLNIWRSDISRRMLMNVAAGASFVPKAAVDAVYKAKSQKRIFDVVTVDSAKIGGIPVPDEKTLEEFYDKNTALFMDPEYRDITIATLSLDALAKDTDVSGVDLSAYYETSKERLVKPETRNIVQSVLFSQEQAEQLSQRARVSGDLSLTAKSMNEPVIPIDNIEAGTLMPDLARAVFSMKAGDVSEPIKTQLGWHVIQLRNINAAGVPSFDEAKDEILAEIRLEKAKDEAVDIINKLDDELAAGKSLDDLAGTLRLRLVKIQGIDNAGVLRDGSLPRELPGRNMALQHAFSQE
ncbi:MAG: SurA N-terminal domain-containing protein, partial [Alphaproteobacteria bacterium]|nr:SurA N-terminal domain-containing protein [Alphaproteobacteria bacterium]